MRIIPRMLGAVLAAACIATPALAADAFPDKPVHLVVPQAPGGASDTLARILGQFLGQKWKQSVVVENRAGAGGNIGMEYVAKSGTDGYTLLMSYEGSHAINPAIYRHLPFDVKKDFTPVATVATLPFVVVTSPKSGIRSLQDLVKAAKEKRMTFGSAGNGSVNHLLGEMFNGAAGVKMVHVPYRGAAPAIQDLLGGQIDVVFTSFPSVKGYIDAGTLLPLAVTSAKRSASAPDIPTIAEQGYPSFDVNPWFGLFAAGGVSADKVDKMNRDINQLLATPEIAEKFAAQGAVVYATTPREFSQQVDAALAKWAEVVKASGAQVE
ncbi:Bug family tripartite tricarboxylate transporter substrate binding protein [Bordetella bronchialis]|uniref:LacI family transcriptional regulator n=1 Tax=Bordetella bronchialis TaxID=463025 RepID=A0A193FJ13_9BORD|nr:tripartite tricarboxylate transporter substrate binding protein [Bordetella bronchialis]ANN67099.1 LacI family transcriptional regulator [Bordetella bronchialis]ANN72179.1 LacI family transcriptional regulator [Bordetella bronchialis]